MDKNRASAVLLVGVLLCIFYLQLAPHGLTWDLGGTDGGELAAAVIADGLVHSPGYPTYLVINKFVTKLPYQDLAWRLNISSAFFAALSILCLGFVMLSIKQPPALFPLVIALFFWGFQEQVWTQAIIVEVYALAAFFCTLTLLLALIAINRKDERFFFLWAISIGLGFGAHYMTGFIALFTGLWLVAAHRWLKLRTWLIIGAGLIIGLSVFSILPLRAGNTLISNWGNPNTFERFWWVVRATAYSDRFVASSAFARMASLVREMVFQIGFVGLLFAFLGLTNWSSERKIWFRIGVPIIIINLWLVAGYLSADILPYLYPTLILLTIALADGITNLLTMLPARFRSIGAVTCLILIIFPLVQRAYPQINSVNLAAAEFAESRIEAAPVQSVLISDVGRESFALRYGVATQKRQDVVLIDLSLLAYDWYRIDIARQIEAPESLWLEQITPYTIDRIVELVPPSYEVRFVEQNTSLITYRLVAAENGLFKPLRVGEDR